MVQSKRTVNWTTRDRDIRTALISALQTKYPNTADDLILEEFGCNTARIDIAVINGALHGYEIKSDGDSISRLEQQLEAYYGVFDYVTVVSGRKLFNAIRQIVPETCGLILAAYRDDELTLKDRRKARRNPNQRHYDLARMMWRDEALRCMRSRGLRTVNSRNSAEQIWRAAATSLDLEVLADELRLSIKCRGGSGFVKQSGPSGGLCTTGSIALLDHYSKNLAWLLSVISDDHPR